MCSPIVNGHSMGGFVVQKYLERHSASAGRLPASVPPSGILRTDFRLAVRHPITFANAISSVSLLPIAPTPALARDALFSEVLGEKELAACSTRLQGESFGFFWHPRLRPFSNEKGDDARLCRRGENDKMFYPDDMRRLREPMEGGRGYSTAWRRI